jgi:hypothetical protein
VSAPYLQFVALPVELRDMIYERIFDDPNRVDSHLRGCPCHVCEDPHHDISTGGFKLLAPFEYVPGHLRNPNFVGRAVLKELAQTWYSCGRFIFLSCHATSRFLREDHWGLGLVPRHLVSSLSIQILAFDWRMSENLADARARGTRILESLSSLWDTQLLKPSAIVTLVVSTGPFEFLTSGPVTDNINRFPEAFRVIVSALRTDIRFQKRKT